MMPNFLIWGQPGSGKTTLANLITTIVPGYMVIDGDDLRGICKNQSYSFSGRFLNIENALMIAKFLNRKEISVILAMMAPYKQFRKMIREDLPGIKFVMLQYDQKNEKRGRENYWCRDFEYFEDNDLSIDTGKCTINESAEAIIKLLNLKPKSL